MWPGHLVLFATSAITGVQKSGTHLAVRERNDLEAQGGEFHYPHAAVAGAL
jgi:hypothetical protein